MRRRYILGLAFSFLFAWAVSLLFVDTLTVYECDPATSSHVFARDTVKRTRSEGYGETYIGAHGVPRHRDISASTERKVAFLGNSYVEAFHVDDKDKMDSVFTELCASHGMKGLLGYAAGRSGDCVADYYFRIIRYDRIVSSTLAYVIIISDMRDLLPDVARQRCEFRSRPELQLVERNPAIPYQGIKRVFYDYNLAFLWNILLSVQKAELDFLPGIAGEEGAADNEPAIPGRETWAFLLERFRSATNARIVFVYCPYVPSIADGKVLCENPDRKAMEDFEASCAKRGIGYIDMSEAFCNHYGVHGQFPRGFSNSRVAEGHFNQVGHRLVAAEVFSYLRQKGLE